VEVSLLNKVYTGHCVPRERSFRKELRMKYNAKFGGYSLEQDEMILRRFRGLVDEVVTEGTAREFLQSVMETCNGENQQELHTSKFRTIAVRNIIGLYVGQDIPNKIAFVHFSRLVKLAFNSSPLSKYVPVATPKKTCRVRWTAEDLQLLLRRVLQAQSSVDLVENIQTIEVDWDGIAASKEFGDRSGKNLREQFQRAVFPALVDELEPEAILHYRRELLTAIREQGAHSRLEINWRQLEGRFRPKTSMILQQNFSNLTKGGKQSRASASAEEFDMRVSEALQKIERQLSLPGNDLEKLMRAETRKELKLGLREQFYIFASESKP